MVAARVSWVRFQGQTLVTVTGNVWGKSYTGGITLKNVLDLSVLHSYRHQIKQKTKNVSTCCYLVPVGDDDVSGFQGPSSLQKCVRDAARDVANVKAAVSGSPCHR